MATYFLMNVVFMGLVVFVLRKFIVKKQPALYFTFLVLLVLTAVFDNVIIGLSVVDYDATKLLGIYIGRAPIEDFFYILLAVILVPALWSVFARSKGEK